MDAVNDEGSAEEDLVRRTKAKVDLEKVEDALGLLMPLDLHDEARSRREVKDPRGACSASPLSLTLFCFEISIS